MTAPGFLTASTELVPPVDESEAFAQLELVRGAVLVAHVDLPETERASILPQRFDGGDERIFARDRNFWNGLSQAIVPTARSCSRDWSRGAGTVVDEESSLASTEAELFPGEGGGRVELDLRSVTWVSGRVDVPDPAELARVVVLVEGADAPPSPRFWLPGQEPPAGAGAGDGSFVCECRAIAR